MDDGRGFPGEPLFRGFRIARDLRKIVLAALALLVLALGNWAFSYLPFAPPRDDLLRSGGERGLTDMPARAALAADPRRDELAAGADAALDRPWDVLVRAVSQWDLVLWPLRLLIDPAVSLLRSGLTWREAAMAWTQLLWALCVWAVFGGAIVRMAAVQFARDQSVGMGAAVRFSLSKFLSFLSAPLLPIALIGLLWLLCLLGGLVGRIPYVGEPLVGVLWFLPLLAGFAMALLTLYVVAGLPLMYATIGAEGSDAFDGFSRSFSYVFSRPWQYLGLALVALIYGSIVIVFAAAVAWLTVYLAGWSVASGMGTAAVTRLYALAADFLAGWVLPLAEAPAAVGVGARLTGIWLAIVALLLAGFVYSYFWSASTIIYFLLRRSEDAIALDEVYLPEAPEPDPLLPLVGVAASEQPVIERPVRPPAAPTEVAPATDTAHEERPTE